MELGRRKYFTFNNVNKHPYLRVIRTSDYPDKRQDRLPLHDGQVVSVKPVSETSS